MNKVTSDLPADVSYEQSVTSDLPADVSYEQSVTSDLRADVSIEQSVTSDLPADVSYPRYLFILFLNYIAATRYDHYSDVKLITGGGRPHTYEYQNIRKYG